MRLDSNKCVLVIDSECSSDGVKTQAKYFLLRCIFRKPEQTLNAAVKAFRKHVFWKSDFSVYYKVARMNNLQNATTAEDEKTELMI